MNKSIVDHLSQVSLEKVHRAAPGRFGVLAIIMSEASFAGFARIVKAVLSVVAIKLVGNVAGFELTFDGFHALNREVTVVERPVALNRDDDASRIAGFGRRIAVPGAHGVELATVHHAEHRQRSAHTESHDAHALGAMFAQKARGAGGVLGSG